MVEGNQEQFLREAVISGRTWKDIHSFEKLKWQRRRTQEEQQKAQKQEIRINIWRMVSRSSKHHSTNSLQIKIDWMHILEAKYWG